MEIKYNNLALKQIAKKYGLDFLVLFGSQSNGIANKHSDYDIGYSADEDIDLQTEYQLSENLKKALDHDKIDLVNIGRVSPLLAKKALLDGKLLAENIPQSFAKEQIRAYHNYIETKPLRKLY